jgi:hypothetical protein
VQDAARRPPRPRTCAPRRQVLAHPVIDRAAQVEQAAEDHRVADVADEELVEQ